MKIALYKGRKRLFNKLVAWWTRGPYSHVELVLDDGISISSSFMDGGVRKKRIDFDLSNWDFIELGLESDWFSDRIDKRLAYEQSIRDRIFNIKGKLYDVLGIAGFVIRRIGEDRNKMFCSEAVAYILGFDDPWRFDPNTLASALKAIKRNDRR